MKNISGLGCGWLTHCRGRVYSDSERKQYSLMFRGENQTNVKLTEKQAIEIYNDAIA